jgi:hypothetical protein
MRNKTQTFEIPLKLSEIEQSMAEVYGEREEDFVHELFYLMQLIQKDNRFFSGQHDELSAIVAQWAEQSSFEISPAQQKVIERVVVAEFLTPAYIQFHQAVLGVDV